MIIVGLGNPGLPYEQTRHNLGFMVADALAIALNGSPWKKEQMVRWSKIDGHYIIKPQEFMNLSGQSLRAFLDYKHLDLSDSTQLLVIHDDLDFPLGEIHQQVNRSAGGHNGIQSIIDALGTQNFGRLRIGIGNNRDVMIPAEEYVLQHFTTAEKKIIDDAVNQAVTILTEKIRK